MLPVTFCAFDCVCVQTHAWGRVSMRKQNLCTSHVKLNSNISLASDMTRVRCTLSCLPQKSEERSHVLVVDSLHLRISFHLILLRVCKRAASCMSVAPPSFSDPRRHFFAFPSTTPMSCSMPLYRHQCHFRRVTSRHSRMPRKRSPESWAENAS